MVSSSQIKEHLALYLANQISLQQFEDWFVPNTRDVRRTHSEAALATTFAVEGVLSEYLSRILDEQELRNALLQILDADNVVLEIVDAPRLRLNHFTSSSPSAFLPVTV